LKAVCVQKLLLDSSCSVT